MINTGETLQSGNDSEERRRIVWPFKKKVIKKIDGAAWGHLVHHHEMDVDTLYREMRCVEREVTEKGKEPIIHLRVFKPAEAERKGVEVEGWRTFDHHPDLIHFEGYVKKYSNEAFLERKKE
jgi:hypothetical protein